MNSQLTILLISRHYLVQTDDNYEVAFNKSFISIEAGNWDEAEALLMEAESM